MVTLWKEEGSFHLASGGGTTLGGRGARKEPILVLKVNSTGESVNSGELSTGSGKDAFLSSFPAIYSAL